MASRLPLSILAAVFGAALMYLLLPLFGVAEQAAFANYARVGVAGGLLVLAIGWLRIYCDRSARPVPAETEARLRTVDPVSRAA